MAGDILISGFSGAGKSSLIGHLSGKVAGRLIEIDGLNLPETSGEQAMICVVDAVNLSTLLEGRLSGELVAAQIARAGLVVVTRSDAVDASGAVDRVKGLTDAPVLDAPFGKIDPSGLAGLAARAGGAFDISDGYARWTYQGPAVLGKDQAQALLKSRPPGIYRLSGQVRSSKGGFDLQVVGRSRQITPIDMPAESRLSAIGPADRFVAADMDLCFAQAVAASAHLGGLFSHR